MDYAFYDDKYGYLLRDGFQKEKGSRKKFLKACAAYDNEKYDDALKQFSALEAKCTDYQEHTAVFLMEGLCYTQKKMWNGAVAAYQKVLEKDSTYSRAWSNLGYIYFVAGKSDLAQEAYHKAAIYDPHNEYAYNNLAAFYLYRGDFAEALENALIALQLNNRLAAAMSAAATAYAHLGDRENAEKYSNMYKVAGGNYTPLKDMIDKILLSKEQKGAV